jgi:hypothetical protein
MKGWRCVIQICLWRATLARFCSSACRSFFVRQAEPPEQPPDRTGINADTALRRQARGHFLKCDLAPGLYLPAHPVFVRRQLADTRIALTFRRKRSGFALEFDHVINELDRDIKPRRR